MIGIIKKVTGEKNQGVVSTPHPLGVRGLICSVCTVFCEGPFNYYVTLFRMILTSPPCHKVSNLVDLHLRERYVIVERPSSPVLPRYLGTGLNIYRGSGGNGEAIQKLTSAAAVATHYLFILFIYFINLSIEIKHLHSKCNIS